MSGERDLGMLLRSMEPTRRAGEFVFVTVPSPMPLPAVAMVREDEGISYVLRRRDADERALAYDFVAAWITLDVHSSLEAVGLTAVVTAALAEAGIACNVIAGFFHDHILVPHDRADDALDRLRSLRDHHQS